MTDHAATAECVRDWYCVYTDVNCEGHAERGLKQRGFEAYLPRYVKLIRRGGRGGKLVPVARPLFARYLFVAFDRELEPWQFIGQMFGVERLLSHGEIPMRVPAGAVEAIRLAELAGEFSPSTHISELQLQVGELVRVKDGPFKDFIAQVTACLDDKGRVEILVNLFGRANYVKIGLDSVEKECT